MVVWITGLSGAGKTTIGESLFNRIKSKYSNTIFLDGDVFRNVIGNHGYKRKDRLDLAKKISNLCSYLENQNINVVCSTISLFNEVHKLNRDQIKEYYEIFIDVDFKELVDRDQKGLYSGALKGEIEDVVGVDINFDIPINPHLIINNNELIDLEKKVDEIVDLIQLEEKINERNQ